MNPCVVKQHFTCDGTGSMCLLCNESPDSCDCDDEQELENCEGCDGAGRVCVEHDSPCGDLKSPPRCDAAKLAAKNPGTFRPFDEKPCKACPFRRTSLAGWLGDAPPEMFIGNIQREIPSPCHSSIDYGDPDWKEQWEAGEIGKLCTGTLVMAANMCKLARNQSIVPKVPQDFGMVFSQPQEFVDHHRAAKVQSWNEESTDADDREPATKKRSRRRA